MTMIWSAIPTIPLGSGLIVMAYLDDGDHKVGSILELGLIDVKVSQLIPVRLVHHKPTSLSDCIDAPQVGGGIQVGIGSFWQRYVWYTGVLRRIAICALHGRQRAVQTAIDVTTDVAIRRVMSICGVTVLAVFA